MAFLELHNVSKSYGRGPRRTDVLRNVSLTIAEGEFIAIVGFSGSGKTTLLSLIAGLTAPDTGTIHCHGQAITGPGPSRGIMFQTYALLPWLTALENVRLAVDAVQRQASAAERDQQAEHFLDLVGLTPARNKRPHELSGGMRQRVSLARTLAMSPELLLLDEPLGALDALTRGNLQIEIARIWSVQRKTCVLITNDVDEALLLADRIIPLTPGPGASLGRAFNVDLPRPRDPKELNLSPRFRTLRNELMNYMIGMRKASRAAARLAASLVAAAELPQAAPIAEPLAAPAVAS